MTPEEMAVTYRTVMRPCMGDLAGSIFIVRQWDGMDGCWTDCCGPVSKEEALTLWCKHTENGTKRVSFQEIDYYKIFPAETRMVWDGSVGREMHRGPQENWADDPRSGDDDEI